MWRGSSVQSNTSCGGLSCSKVHLLQSRGGFDSTAALFAELHKNDKQAFTLVDTYTQLRAAS